MKKIGLKENILKLRKEGLTYNQIVEKLGCAKSSVSYYCKFDKPSTDDKEIEIKQPKVKTEKTIKKVDIINVVCEICEKTFETKIKSQFTCSKSCRKEYKKRYLKGRGYEYATLVSWRQKQKNLAIDYKGGKCVECGYNKCNSALEFHHTDPNEKDFTISSNKNLSFKKIKKELDKCILLCSNCHREKHEKIKI